MTTRVRPSLPRRLGQEKRFPIIVIGWRDARELVANDGYSILKYDDGHAELLNARKEAAFFLRRRSVELLEASG
jgi:hypothetical protein